MTKQNYLSEFTEKFSQLATMEEVMNTQKELCKTLFSEYAEKPIGKE